MDKSEFFKEIMEKLMGMPYEDEEMESLGKKGAKVIKIEMVGGDEGPLHEAMESPEQEKAEHEFGAPEGMEHEDAAMDKKLIEAELKKRLAGMAK